jgi:hypothetical protein
MNLNNPKWILNEINSFIVFKSEIDIDMPLLVSFFTKNSLSINIETKDEDGNLRQIAMADFEYGKIFIIYTKSRRLLNLNLDLEISTLDINSMKSSTTGFIESIKNALEFLNASTSNVKAGIKLIYFNFLNENEPSVHFINSSFPYFKSLDENIAEINFSIQKVSAINDFKSIKQVLNIATGKKIDIELTGKSRETKTVSKIINVEVDLNVELENLTKEQSINFFNTAKARQFEILENGFVL